MPDQTPDQLTYGHLEMFVFDPHRASEEDVRAMARGLLAARARITELEAAHDLARDIARSNSHALNEAQDDLRTARELIDWFTDDEPCDFDHHGGCQAHGHFEPEPGEQCPNETAKQWLTAHPVAEAGA